MDPRMQRMAEVVTRYSADVQPDDWVVIQTTPLGELLAVACAESALCLGANPSVLIESEALAEAFYRVAGERQLEFVSPVRETVTRSADVLIRIAAPMNPSALNAVPPAKLARQGRAHGPLGALFSRRAAEGALRWVSTQFPTPAAAQSAGMSLRAYEDFVYGACLLDEPDPIGSWTEVRRRQQRLIDWLRDKHIIHLTGPDTDLTVEVTDRVWINSDGRRNFPSGEIFTGPHENATQGIIRFTYPAFRLGREVTDVRLTFESGRVVAATATSGEDFLHEMLDMDAGARRLGEVAFGLNEGITRFTRNTLFDEKIAGTMHIALGSAYPESGGTNASALHWDMVYDLRQGAKVTIDGTFFSRDGKILV